MDQTFYITTPIYYVNSHPHIGHAYTSMVADTLRRYQQLFGNDTYFLTGTDEHGQKIAESAAQKGVSPQKFVDEMSREFKDLWPRLHVHYDQFIRTTEAHHKACVQRVLQQIYDQGEIYLKEYEGLYCVGCERFLDEGELVEGNCPDHQKPPQHYKEKNYFFKMSAYQDWLIETVENQPDLIYPAKYRNEVLRFLKDPLQDLCISRPKSRLSWGIDLPFDSDFVTYVWFDALLNYVSALGWPEDDKFQKFWTHTHHLIGKDILKTHAIYWPCMLKAAGIPIFHKLLVHGHWLSQSSKMSKTLGNVVDPLAMIDKVGVDALRYFLLRDMSFGEDSNFAEKQVVNRYNADLANNIGNLINRSISMSLKPFQNRVPPSGPIGELEKELQQRFINGIEQVKTYILAYQPHRALEEIESMSSAVNKYIDTSAPWKLLKQEGGQERLGTVLYTALDMARILVDLLFPVMPEKMLLARKALGLNAEIPSLTKLKPGGLLEGTELPPPSPLFPKIKPVDDEPLVKESEPASAQAMITIEEFGRMKLRVGKIIQCQRVPKSDKLVHSQVDLGEERPRSIVSGIAKFYQPEELVGRTVMVVSNLIPVKLRGVLSEGMILCTDEGTQLQLVEPPEKVKPGTKIC
ncbi:methionine--tRNA ligase [Deltaproteobacteria bacterium TL4]